MIASAPKGSMFEHPEQLEAQAALIHKQVVELKIMPPGNITGLTEAERAAVDGWFQGLAGAAEN